jgi:peptidoglycan/LPS O-acetylase OafA/YrhL
MRLGYRQELDGIRGLAIGLVVSFHAFGWPRAGTLGVDLFFVLSGFLITTLLLEEHALSHGVSIRRFYVRRARRLLPALFALLAAFLLITVLSTAARGTFHPPAIVGLAAALTYTSNIVVAADPSAVPAALIHLWSLAAEEQFYILWPLLLLLFLRRGGVRFAGRGLVVLLVCSVLYRLGLTLAGASGDRLFYAPDTHADSLLIGCAVACWFSERSVVLAARHRRQELGAGLALALVLAGAVLLDRVPTKVAYELQLVPTAFALTAAALIVYAAIGSSLVARALSARPMVFLGGISYSLYLWHLPLLVAFSGTERYIGARTIGAVVTALAVATASRAYVELPFLARRTSRQREDPRAAPTVATA